MEPVEWQKYIFAFLISAVIFSTALLASSYLNDKKIETVRSIESRLSLDILSTETQFALLEQSSCKTIGNSVLSGEIGLLGDKLSITESRRGSDDPEVIHLKKNYSLLQIKDYLLMKKISQKCGRDQISILYFYSNKGDCEDCEREGYVLTHLYEKYPGLRVYSFDYNLEMSALQTLISINKIENRLPALLIGDETYYGFKSVEDLEAIMPELKTLEVKEAATSTQKI